MQSCLEKRGRTERENEMVRSDYNNFDVAHNYSETHKDALSDGDIQGKGSANYKGHSYWKPHYYPHNMIKYDNFDTSPESNIGGCYDINGRLDNGGRLKSFAADIFSPDYKYSRDLIGTQLKK